jgi:hypothetical protein
MSPSFPSVSTPTHLLTQTIDTQRQTITFDSGGSPIRTFNVNLSAVPANVQPVKQEFFDPYSNRRVYKQALRIYVDPRLDIVPTDRIVFAGQTYEQISSSEDLLAASVLRRLDCRQVVE